MTPFHSIQALLQQATEKGSRSTILRPLGWSLPVWIAAILGAIHEKADFWLIVLFSVFTSLTGIAYLGTYAYCLLKNKETLLRSETYSIQERLIDKGIFGDSAGGTFHRTLPQATTQLASAAKEEDA